MPQVTTELIFILSGSIERLQCLFLLHISSEGVKQDVYCKITHTLTLQVAETLSRINTGITFCYISAEEPIVVKKADHLAAKKKTERTNETII